MKDRKPISDESLRDVEQFIEGKESYKKHVTQIFMLRGLLNRIRVAEDRLAEVHRIANSDLVLALGPSWPMGIAMSNVRELSKP